MMRRLFLTVLIVITISASHAEASANIETVETRSGHTVWLVQDHNLPVVTIKMLFPRSGAAQDPQGKAGLASFVSQMLDEGAGDMNALAFRQALESKAIRMAVDGGQDAVTVTLQTLSEHKAEAFDLLLLALTKPRFDTEAVERIRASIISDLSQLEEEPVYVASREWKERAFAGHPYRFPRRGTPETVKAITAEDLRQFARSHFFTGEKPVIGVTGDITAEEIRNWDLPPHKSSDKSHNTLADIVMPEGGDTPVIREMNVPQTVVTASLPGLRRTDPQYPALQILNYVLGGSSITSRLGGEVRDKQGLAYHIGSEIEIMDHAAFLSVGFATRNEQALKAWDIVRGILNDMASKGVTEQELRDAKSYLIGAFPLDQDTQNELAGMLVGIQYYNLGRDYMDKRASLIEKVTLSDVNALASQLLSRVPLVVMAGSPNNAPAAKAEAKTE